MSALHRNELNRPQEHLGDALTTLVGGLLTEAAGYFGKDRHAAKLLIDHASSLLAFESELPARAKDTLAETAAARQHLAPWQAVRVRVHIDDHLDQTIRIEHLAAIARISPSYFFRAFKGSFGLSPHAYIVKRRILRAQKLLTDTEASLCDIAIACGLADQAHFSRLFRRETGQSPGAWRRDRAALTP